jgi:methylase of polypeptide subunit release factors
MASAPPDPSDRFALAKVRTALDSSGYDPANVKRLVTEETVGAYVDGWNNPALRRTEPKTALSTLVRLFALGLDVPAADLDAVPGAAMSDWMVAGLVAVRRRTVHPLVLIQPLRISGIELRLVSDVPNPGLGRPQFPEFVMGGVESSLRLANMTLRGSFASALDMGTGNGVQAILASRHCRSVVATDVNPRALAFTRFNLAINGVENVELRQGDRYEPVSGGEFDLIVSNPPFVVSPSAVFQFRDSGLPTDTISATAVTGAADHLAPGGWAQIMCQWIHTDAQHWEDRVGEWVAGTACDAWAVQLQAVDSVAHATEWLTELGRANPKEADRQFKQWMRYYDLQGIVGVGSGFVVLRKKDSDVAWYRADELETEITEGTGEMITRIFEAQGWLYSHPQPDAILDTYWSRSKNVELDTTQGATGQRWEENRHVLRQGTGLRTSVELTKELAEIVSRCDGSKTLRTLAMEVFQGRWRDPARRTEEIETPLRQLAAAGFLVPVTESP